MAVAVAPPAFQRLPERSSIPDMRTTLKRLCSSPTFIAITTLALRMAGVLVAYKWKPWLVANMSSTGGEVIQVARSILSGKGFGNPMHILPSDTGPTAWLCPVYPYIVAGVSRLTGIHTVKSTLILVALNCVFVGLTIFPIYAIARRTFGVRAAVIACWIWVLIPSAWNIPTRFVWDSTLNAFSFAVLFWATLAVLAQRRLWSWLLYGLLWAMGVLINASILSLSPFVFAWLLWQLRKQSPAYFKFVATAALTFALGVAPWSIRNYLVFGKFIPIRSNLGLVLWMGNHEGTFGFDASLSPYWNLDEAKLYQKMGEVAYMKEKKREAIAFMKSHPATALKSTLRNVWTFWFDVTNHLANPWRGRQLASVDLTCNAIVVFCCLLGIFLALHVRNPASPLYLAVLVFFPLVHYVTRPAVRFRFAIEPILVVLAGYGAVHALEWIRAMVSKRAPEGLLDRADRLQEKTAVP